MIILPKEGECWEGKAVGEHLREEGGGERQKERWGEEEEREPWQDDMHAEKEEEKGSEDGVGGEGGVCEIRWCWKKRAKGEIVDVLSAHRR